MSTRKIDGFALVGLIVAILWLLVVIFVGWITIISWLW